MTNIRYVTISKKKMPAMGISKIVKDIESPEFKRKVAPFGDQKDHK